MNQKINLAEKLALLEKPYEPGIVGFINDTERPSPPKDFVVSVGYQFA